MKTSSWDRKMGVSPWGRWAGTPSHPGTPGRRGEQLLMGQEELGGNKGVPRPPQGAPQSCGGGDGPCPTPRSLTELVEVSFNPVWSWHRADKTGLQEGAPLVHEAAVASVVVLQQRDPHTQPCPPPLPAPCPLLHLPGRCARCGNRRQGSAERRPTSLGRRSTACRRSSRCCRG